MINFEHNYLPFLEKFRLVFGKICYIRDQTKDTLSAKNIGRNIGRNPFCYISPFCLSAERTTFGRKTLFRQGRYILVV